MKPREHQGVRHWIGCHSYAGLRIISRITHEKNIEAIYRAGADFAISYASLGAEEVFAQLHSRELLILGEGFELFCVLVPKSLAGRTLRESEISARTGLSVIGIQQNGRMITRPSESTQLSADSELVVLGSTSGRQACAQVYST
jgi:Trk K+ transport system NAD-binding subunit